MNQRTLSRPMPSHGKVTEPVVDHTADPMDISDVWAQEVENETGAIVHAYFDHCWTGDRFNPIFRGLSILVDNDTTYTTDFGGIDLLGVDTIARLEEAYSGELNQ